MSFSDVAPRQRRAPSRGGYIMRNRCPFLEYNDKRPWLPLYTCAAGVNFRSVGEEAVLCSRCPLGQEPARFQCKHLLVYTYLVPGPGGQPAIDVQLECDLSEGMLEGQRCSVCPGEQSTGTPATGALSA